MFKRDFFRIQTAPTYNGSSYVLDFAMVQKQYIWIFSWARIYSTILSHDAQQQQRATAPSQARHHEGK